MATELKTPQEINAWSTPEEMAQFITRKLIEVLKDNTQAQEKPEGASLSIPHAITQSFPNENKYKSSYQDFEHVIN